MKKILVTGGAGYIGSILCKELSKAGFIPITFDNLDTGHKWAVRWGEFIYGDIRNSEALANVFSSHKIDSVFHLAGFSSVNDSFSKPDCCYSINIAGTLQLLNMMRQHDVKKLVFASSCAVYGNVGNMPINENHPQNPINPYGYSKSVAEKIIYDYSASYGIKSISLRFFNAAGADFELEVGEHKKKHTHLIPILFDYVSGVTNEFIVFGSDYETPDGTCVRDYIHVWDLAQAFIKSNSLLNNLEGSYSYNLGSGIGYSVKQIIKSVEKVVDHKVIYICGEERLGDPPYLIADISNAANNLQWKPSITQLDIIIDIAWRWYKKAHKYK